MEIRDFLAARPPFDTLPPEQLDALPKHFVVRYLRRGSAFPAADDPGPNLYILRTGAIELRNQDARLVEKLGEGDVWPAACDPRPQAPRLDGTAVEDSLLYVLSCDQLRALCGQFPDCAAFFDRTLGAGLKQAAAAGGGDCDDGTGGMNLPVAALLTRAPVTGDADASIQATAILMTEQNASSVMLLRDGRLVGLITDSDLRRRCVAEDCDIQRPVAEVMSTDLCTVARQSPVLDALMTMTRHHIGHLPVMDGERVAGMLTATDIARHHSNHSGFVVNDIRKANDQEALVQIAARLPEMQLQLTRANADARQVGEAVSHITDALTRRLIELAEQELGPPPVAYVWLCGGSQARREQTAHSDQDNALLIADDLQDRHQPWFEALARRVNDGLNACGFVYCPGDAMASNPRWRQPLRQWQRYFSDWIDKPDPKALMLTSIFFDLRPVHSAGNGADELFEQLQRGVLRQSRDNGIFTAYMAANALQHRPPLGFFRNFVLVHGGEHDHTLDIKRRGIAPITDLARSFALAQGLTEVNTHERLAAAAESGAVSAKMGENLQDALALIAGLRIRHQARQIQRGDAPDNYLPPDEISELERKHLKEAFRVIELMQETLENRYQLGRFR